MANPVLAWINTFVAGEGGTQSGFVSFSFAFSQEFQAKVPIEVALPNSCNFSFAPEVWVFDSTDGGASYETDEQGTLEAVFQADGIATARVMRKNIILNQPGTYIVAVQVGSHQVQSFSAGLGTAEMITAYA